MRNSGSKARQKILAFVLACAAFASGGCMTMLRGSTHSTCQQQCRQNYSDSTALSDCYRKCNAILGDASSKN